MVHWRTSLWPTVLDNITSHPRNPSSVFMKTYNLIIWWVSILKIGVHKPSCPWRWHIRPILRGNGEGKCNETRGMDHVFAPGDLAITIFYSCVPGFGIHCTCSVWYRGLTICLLCVSPRFGNPVLNDTFVCFTQCRKCFFISVSLHTYI